MTLSFRARLALQWNLAFGLLLALACVVIYVSLRAFLLGNFDADLRMLAATEVASSTDTEEGAHLHEFTPDPRNPDFSQKFVQLLDLDGRLILQSPGLHSTHPLVQGDALVDAFNGASPIRPVTVNGRPGRLITLRSLSTPPYLVAVGTFTDRVDTTLAWIRRLLVGVWLVAIVMTGLIGHTLASRALRPIRRITTRAAEIAQGRFAARLDPPAVDDEIGQMTRLLNEMLDRLSGAIEANRRFAADASHELRSPLTAVIGEVDLSLKRDRAPEDYRRTLAMVRERMQQMAALTDDLMLLVRAQEGKTGPLAEIALAPLLAAVVDRHAAAAAARDLTVTLDTPGDVVAYGDARLLDRVFDNLVRNALQYNAEHGRVDITATLNPRDGDWVTDEAIVTVRDTGPGIPAAERERIFERFYRLDPSRSRRTGGAGLGLAIAREIVTLFGGTIRVADTTSPGAAIEVRLRGGRPA